MVWRKSWEDEDKEKDEPKDKRTLRELRKMANSLESDIRMKEGAASNHATGKLPMLDVQMWVENGKIAYSFYEKPMVLQLVMMENSALPVKVKIQVLAQEVVRRRRNTHKGEGKTNIDREMTRFVVKLKMSVMEQGGKY